MKFINLLKKELSELLTAQMLMGIVLIFLVFMFLGSFMQDAVNEEAKAVTAGYSKMCISDCDSTDFTQDMLDSFREKGVKVSAYETEGDDYAKILSDNKLKSIIIIPKGFTAAVENGEKPNIITASRMASASSMSLMSTGTSAASSMIKNYVKNYLASQAGMDEKALEILQDPLTITENTVVDDKSAQTSVDVVSGKLMIQNMILPIIVFVLILLTSQMLISAIANEKIDKTLETLLSAPVSRGAVISAKMLAAAIIALINAAVYMLGFSKFVGGATESVTSEITSSIAGQYLSADEAITQLGLRLSVGDYFLVGLQLFFTILICLSISIILGALVNDTKSSQTVLMPIMILAMVPYMISMLKDVNTLPTAAKIIVYAIPFTHTFSAMSNIMFGNTAIFFGGLAYQAAVFAVCMFFALKLFKSDKIFTISLNLGSKSRFRKNSGSQNEN